MVSGLAIALVCWVMRYSIFLSTVFAKGCFVRKLVVAVGRAITCWALSYRSARYPPARRGWPVRPFGAARGRKGRDGVGASAQALGAFPSDGRRIDGRRLRGSIPAGHGLFLAKGSVMLVEAGHLRVEKG